MDSRIRANPNKSFEVFLELLYQPSGDHLLIKKYPEDFNDTKFLHDVSRFAFPYGEIPESSVVDHFTFVLTDVESKFRFGFCRHSSDTKTCLCIISFLPWYEVFYKLLNQLAEVFNRGCSQSPGSGFNLLQAVYTKRVFGGATQITISPSDLSQKFSFTPPNMRQLPSIPQSRNLTEYYNAIDADNMITVYASLMQERRVLVVSRKLGRLTACIQAAASLIFPMFCAPMPYIIGVHSSLREKLRPQEIGDAVILDADNNHIHSDYDDVGDLPSDVVSALRKSLKSSKSGGNNLMGDGVARAFLRATVALIGGYRDALVFEFDKPVTFSEERFIETRPPKMQNFLRKMLRLQIFEMFIAERLAMLNNMEEPSDEFEHEIAEIGDKWNPKSRYQELLGDMKTRFQRDGKDKIMNLKHKVRVQGRKAITDTSLKVEMMAKEDDYKGLTHNRPGTTPKSDGKSIFYEKDSEDTTVQYRRKNSANRNSSFRRAQDNQIEVKRKSGTTRRSNCISFDDMELPPKINLDLTMDPDIVNVLRKRSSMEDLHEVVTDDEEDGDDDEYSNNNTDDECVTIGNDSDAPATNEQQAEHQQRILLSDLLIPLDIAQTPALHHQLASQQQLPKSISSFVVQREGLSTYSSNFDSLGASAVSSGLSSRLQESECLTNILDPFASSSQSSLAAFTVDGEKDLTQTSHSHSSVFTAIPRPTAQLAALSSGRVVVRHSCVPSQYSTLPPDPLPEINRSTLYCESSNVLGDSMGAILAHSSRNAMDLNTVTSYPGAPPVQLPSPNRISLRPTLSIGRDLFEFDPLQSDNVVVHEGGTSADEPALLQDWKAEHFSCRTALPSMQHGSLQTSVGSPAPFRSSPANVAKLSTDIQPQAAVRPIASMSYLPHTATYTRSSFTPLSSIPGANMRVLQQMMPLSRPISTSIALDPFEAVHNQVNLSLSSASQPSATALPLGASVSIMSSGYTLQPRILNTGPVSVVGSSGVRMQALAQYALSGWSLSGVGSARPVGGPVSPVSMPVIGGQVRISLIDMDARATYRPPNVGEYVPSADSAAGKQWQTFD